MKILEQIEIYNYEPLTNNWMTKDLIVMNIDLHYQPVYAKKENSILN